MAICPLWGCITEIIETVEDTRVVDGHHFVAANFNGQLLHDGTAQILNHSPAGIFDIQSDREGQPRGSGDNHIVFAKVGEPDKQLLVLVDVVGIVGDDHISFTPRGSRRERFGLSLRPNLLQAIVY